MDAIPNNSAAQQINSAHHKAHNAADTIAKTVMSTDETGSKNINNTDIIKPITSLKEAELETSAAVKVLKAENDTIGSLLDVNV